MMRAHLALVLLAALHVPTAAARVQSQRVEDPRRVLVRADAPGIEPDLVRLGQRLGVELVSARRFGPPDAWLIELGDPAPELGALVRDLAGEAGISFAAAVSADPELRVEAPLPVDPEGRVEAPLPWLNVRFERDVPALVQRAWLAGLVGARIEVERWGNMEGVWRLSSDARTDDELRAQVEWLAALPGVRWAEHDVVLEVLAHALIPNDPLFGSCWGLHNTGQTVGGVAGVPDVDMDVPEAWDLGLGSPAVIVLVLDVGVQLNHPDIAVFAAQDFTGSGTGGGPTASCASHGTAVAGCVAGLANNGMGATGVAPGVRIASASIAVDADCDGGHAVSPSWYVDALAWGESLGARVATSQVGPGSISLALSDKYVEVEQNGMLVFAASGNDPAAPIGSPGIHPSVRAVGGITSSAASYGTTGSALFCVAPAENVQTTDLGGGYVVASGTSLASPYAAGVAALVISRHPVITVPELDLALIASCRDLGAVGPDATFGNGLLNARGALAVADEMLASGYVQVDCALSADDSLAGLYSTVGAGAAGVVPGGVVLIRAGSYGETLTIGKPMVLRRKDGVATIGE